MFLRLRTDDKLLRNKKGKVTQNSWQALRKWASAAYLQELVEMEPEAEEIETLEFTPQPNGDYVARIHTASSDQIEVQAQDKIGAFIKLTQSQYSGEQYQQRSDT
jgi:hypothetical protein